MEDGDQKTQSVNGQKIEYTYGSSGYIVKREYYNVQRHQNYLSEPINPVRTDSFGYTNSNWKNQCDSTNINGFMSALSYDAVGNPINSRCYDPVACRFINTDSQLNPCGGNQEPLLLLRKRPGCRECFLLWRDDMNLNMRPDKDICVRKIAIPSGRRSIPALVLSPKKAPVKTTEAVKATGILWLHGGGYIVGMKEMVHMSRAVDLVKRFGAVVVSPGYRLAPLSPYPAALNDCYKTLLYMKSHADQLGVRDDQLMVGGESAGGGLCAAVCIKARTRER